VQALVRPQKRGRPLLHPVLELLVRDLQGRLCDQLNAFASEVSRSQWISSRHGGNHHAS
jgi:hypothetical protein